MRKKFDAVKFQRKIREELSSKYNTDREAFLNELKVKYGVLNMGFEGQVLFLAFLKIARNGRIIECLRLTPKSASGGFLKHSTVRRHCGCGNRSRKDETNQPGQNGVRIRHGRGYFSMSPTSTVNG